MITGFPLPLTKTLAPADQAAVAEAVRTAWEEKTAVYPIGGGTRLDYGMRPTAPGIGLSLEKLNRLIDYQADDLTVTVEAGMTMAELSKILVKRRQRLPIDVAMPDRSTIGGVAATNSSGPRQFAYGSMRDYVLGFSAVDGNGTIFSGGGLVVKNAAGYNMGRLMVGSLGTLGVITQLTLMVRPLPEMSALAACDLPDLETAEKLLADLMQSPLRPAAVELALGNNRPDNPVFESMPVGSAIRLFVGFEGAAVEVQWMLDTLREMWQKMGVSSPMTVTDASAKLLWDWLVDFPADVQIAVRPSVVTQMIGPLLSLDPDCTIQAHAGNGVLRVLFSTPKCPGISRGENLFESHAHGGQEGRDAEKLDPFTFLLRHELRPLVEAADGKLTVIKYPQSGALARRDVWGPRGDGFVVMQSLKDRFDPAGILNPGRFVFDK
jgi:glycolate oxidase FAD binding subunit